MQYIEFPGVETPVSRVVQGAISLFALDDASRFALLDAAVDTGINTFDTAVNYATPDDSVDAILGRWIRHRGGREGIVISAKGCHPELPDWAWHREREVAVVAWSPLAGGFLSERIARQELEGATEGHLADTARCYLSDDNWARRERAAEMGRRLGLSLSLSQVALAWALHADFNPLVIVANATNDEVAENAAAERTVLTEADLDYIFFG